jgi:hypothetical protein
MGNPLLSMTGGGTPTAGNNNNMIAMLQKFQQFRNSFPKNANPTEILNSLVSSGRFTTEQVEQAKQIVQQMGLK